MTEEVLIQLNNIQKHFKVGQQEIGVLKDVNFVINKKDFLIIIGKSGSGKSTLFHIILGLERPNSGNIIFLNDNLYEEGKDEDYLSEFRKHHIGVVYQQSNWIKSLNVLENIAFPYLLLGHSKKESLEKAFSLLTEVEMEGWEHHIPTELSSGQQQRIALARALITEPEVIMADEPTGNLDSESGFMVMNILQKLNEKGKTIVMVTHDLEYLKYANVAIKIENGTTNELYRGNAKTGWLNYMKTKKVYEI